MRKICEMVSKQGKSRAKRDTDAWYGRLATVFAGTLLIVQATGCTGLVPGLPI